MKVFRFVGWLVEVFLLLFLLVLLGMIGFMG